MWLTRCQSARVGAPRLTSLQVTRVKLGNKSHVSGVNKSHVYSLSDGRDACQVRLRIVFAVDYFVHVACMSYVKLDWWETQLSRNICFFVQNAKSIIEKLKFPVKSHCSKWNSEFFSARYSNKSISKTRYQRAGWLIFSPLTFIIGPIYLLAAVRPLSLLSLMLSPNWPTHHHCKFWFQAPPVARW